MRRAAVRKRKRLTGPAPERPHKHIARYPPCTSKAIPAARGGVGPDPPSSRAHGPTLPPLRRRPPSTLGACVSVRSRRLCS